MTPLNHSCGTTVTAMSCAPAAEDGPLARDAPRRVHAQHAHAAARAVRRVARAATARRRRRAAHARREQAAPARQPRILVRPVRARRVTAAAEVAVASAVVGAAAREVLSLVWSKTARAPLVRQRVRPDKSTAARASRRARRRRRLSVCAAVAAGGRGVHCSYRRLFSCARRGTATSLSRTVRRRVAAKFGFVRLAVLPWCCSFFSCDIRYVLTGDETAEDLMRNLHEYVSAPRAVFFLVFFFVVSCPAYENVERWRAGRRRDGNQRASPAV